MMHADEPLVVTDLVAIPAAELTWRFGTSGGPGGQHANRTASRAELSFDVARSRSLRSDLRDRVLDRLGGRAPGGVLTVTVDDSRSQWRNRILARRRMAEILADALRPEPAVRRPTRPPAGARLRRLTAKRSRAETKRLRKKPRPDD